MHKQDILLLATLPLLALFVGHAKADSKINFSGTLIAPPVCSVNGDKDTNVNFGEIRNDKVDGVQYAKDVVIDVVCDADPTGTLQMQLNGTAASYDNAAVTTNIPNLAIKLTRSGTNVVIGTAFDITYPNPVTLTATPIKQAGQTLGTGAFTATATATLLFQ